MTWKKKSPLWEQPFRPEKVNQCPQYGDQAKNNTFSTEQLPVAAADIYILAFV